MNTVQINNALKSQPVTKSFFNGIYSYDTLLKIKKKPKLVICNTDPSYKIGEHWVLFFFNRNVVEFFDSMGKNISFYGKNFVIFIRRFAKYYKQNKSKVQPVKSNLCGHYCLYFSYLRCKGFSMEFILKTIPNYKKIKIYVMNKFQL
jgi:hypothetical protein